MPRIIHEYTLKELEHFIRKWIVQNGAIPFSKFMELALYHPRWGYYSRNETSPDYYTSAEVHPVFAQILASYFCGILKEGFSAEKELKIIELGCGTGALAKPILEWIEQNEPGIRNRLTYIGIEKSGARREAFKTLKTQHKNTAVYSEFNFAEESVAGIVFSNEFFDALPFDRVLTKGGQLHEIRIDSAFKETLVPLSPDITNYFQRIGTNPQEGCAGEAHLSSQEWIGKISKSLRKGLVFTIDYGFEAKELYSEFRTEGTALCHSQHTAHRNFYQKIGEQDITAHVNFTTLIKEAENFGIKSLPLKTQSQFLIENGLEKMAGLSQKIKDPRVQLKTSAAIRSLIHPEGMGGTFKVLIQRKGV